MVAKDCRKLPKLTQFCEGRQFIEEEFLGYQLQLFMAASLRRTLVQQAIIEQEEQGIVNGE